MPLSHHVNQRSLSRNKARLLNAEIGSCNNGQEASVDEQSKVNDHSPFNILPYMHIETVDNSLLYIVASRLIMLYLL